MLEVLIYRERFTEKSNVGLIIETGATFLGSSDLEQYPSIPSEYPSYTGKYVYNKAFIYAEKVLR